MKQDEREYAAQHGVKVWMSNNFRTTRRWVTLWVLREVRDHSRFRTLNTEEKLKIQWLLSDSAATSTRAPKTELYYVYVSCGEALKTCVFYVS